MTVNVAVAVPSCFVVTTRLVWPERASVGMVTANCVSDVPTNALLSLTPEASGGTVVVQAGCLSGAVAIPKWSYSARYESAEAPAKPPEVTVFVICLATRIA